MGDEDLDGMLQKIVELLRANGESWNDTLLISQPDAAGNYTFTAEEGSTRDQKALAAMKDNLGLQQYATANDVMEKLVEDYDLASFPLSWQRTLGGIHYEMQLQAFSNVNNFIMAENVSEATVATIKEHSLSLPGVEIVETSTRSYEQSTVLPHGLNQIVGQFVAAHTFFAESRKQHSLALFGVFIDAFHALFCGGNKLGRSHNQSAALIKAHRAVFPRGGKRNDL